MQRNNATIIQTVSDEELKSAIDECQRKLINYNRTPGQFDFIYPGMGTALYSWFFI